MKIDSSCICRGARQDIWVSGKSLRNPGVQVLSKGWARAARGLKWLMLVSFGVVVFLVKQPRALPQTLRWAFRNLGTLGWKTRRKTDLSNRRALMVVELADAQRHYMECGSLRDCSDLLVLRELSRECGLNRWEVVYFLLIAARCTKVVETGVAEGESTSHILRAIAENGGGRLSSVDLPNQFYLMDNREVHAEFNPPDSSPGFLVPEGLRSYWTLNVGASRRVLPRVLQQSGEIDAFLHDSEHTAETMTFEFELAWPHIRHGGYLISDDANWNGAMAEFALRHEVELVLIEGSGFSLGFVKKP